ncbi:XdhC family protein [Aquimarina longa]|uniref:XdhC family protein n=1 Tax=Aquimarina longa TaxID=1080221 RepID=UPI000783308C|nr:XdhC/CoxI family protein [Aquimarina longa]
MTHEFKEIITSYGKARQIGIPAVMATVVDVEGSSYRRPGVGMLLLQNGKMVGAVSGGCVEKEILRQAQHVFASGESRMMIYDGKYRLGCEGVLYILIEIFEINDAGIVTIQEYLNRRIPFEIKSWYSKEEGRTSNMGSVIQFNKELIFSFSQQNEFDTTLTNFKREIQPCFRLIIIGTEHDATVLCQLASVTGWEVIVIGSPTTPNRLEDFPGAKEMIHSSPEDLNSNSIDVDDQTAIILMSHNFAKDMLYLQAIRETSPLYVGLLGPAKRREKLLSALIEYFPEVSESFLDSVHGPAGLNLGSETPQEIAISIIAEILSVIRGQDPIPLYEKKGAIHDIVPKLKKESVAAKKA